MAKAAAIAEQAAVLSDKQGIASTESGYREAHAEQDLGSPPAEASSLVNSSSDLTSSTELASASSMTCQCGPMQLLDHLIHEVHASA